MRGLGPIDHRLGALVTSELAQCAKQGAGDATWMPQLTLIAGYHCLCGVPLLLQVAQGLSYILDDGPGHAGHVCQADNHTFNQLSIGCIQHGLDATGQRQTHALSCVRVDDLMGAVLRAQLLREAIVVPCDNKQFVARGSIFSDGVA